MAHHRGPLGYLFGRLVAVIVSTWHFKLNGHERRQLLLVVPQQNGHLVAFDEDLFLSVLRHRIDDQRVRFLFLALGYAD